MARHNILLFTIEEQISEEKNYLRSLEERRSSSPAEVDLEEKIKESEEKLHDLSDKYVAAIAM